MTKANSFTLRFPFQLSSNQRISGLDSPFEFTFGSLIALLEQKDTFYILKVSGFSTEAEAQDFAQRIWAGLMWTALHLGIAFKADFEFDSVVYADDPETAAKNLNQQFGLKDTRIDGLVNGNLLAVYPSDKFIRTITAGNVSLVLNNRADQIITFIAQGASFPRSNEIRSQLKLQTSLDLFVSHFFESSSNARLLTLVMVLESLTESQLKHQTAQRLIDSWYPQLLELKRQVVETSPNSEESEALEALERELFFRKEASLRSQIRALVVSSLTRVGHPDPRGMGSRAVKLYDARSTLVHEGTLPREKLTAALRDAAEIARIVLQAQFQISAGTV
jgi:hypothetical protein